MWLITLRDLQWRRRRFAIAVVATAVVFALALLLSGISTSFDNESEVLFNQGAPGDVVYVVEEGEIEIVRVRDDRTEELLTHIGPGRYFGELAPMFGIRRSATARATEPPRVVGLTVGEFRRRYRGEKLSELLQKLA